VALCDKAQTSGTAFEVYNISRRASGHRCGNPLAHLTAQCAHRLVGAVHVSAGHRQILMPEQVAHEKGIRAKLRGIGANGVAQIVQPHVLKLRGGPQLCPRRLDSGFRQWPVAA